MYFKHTGGASPIYFLLLLGRYVNCFIEVSQRDDGKDAKEVVAAVEAMLANDGIVLTRKLVEGRNKKKS